MWNILARGRYDFSFDLMPASIDNMPVAKRINLIKSGINLIHQRSRPYSMPIFMQVELTSYCDLKCPVCPWGSGALERKPLAMDPGLFEKLMDEVGPYLLVLSLWCWGEPLLHPRLSEMLRIAKKHNIITLLSTNGQRLNEESVINALVSYPPTYLIVAIDGITDETNSKFRTGAGLEKALEGARRLAEIKRQKSLETPILCMRYIVMNHNEHEIHQLESFAKDHSFDMLATRKLSIRDLPEETHKSLIPKNEKFRAYKYHQNDRVRRNNFKCEKAFIFPSVFADGSVVPCDHDYNATKSYGTFSKDTSFRKIWFGKKAGKIRRTIKTNREKYSFCDQCPFADMSEKTCSINNIDLRR